MALQRATHCRPTATIPTNVISQQIYSMLQRSFAQHRSLVAIPLTCLRHRPLHTQSASHHTHFQPRHPSQRDSRQSTRVSVGQQPHKIKHCRPATVSSLTATIHRSFSSQLGEFNAIKHSQNNTASANSHAQSVIHPTAINTADTHAKQYDKARRSAANDPPGSIHLTGNARTDQRIITKLQSDSVKDDQPADTNTDADASELKAKLLSKEGMQEMKADAKVKAQQAQGRLKQLWQQYGYVAIGTYLVIYVGTLGAIYELFEHGLLGDFDPMWIVKQLGLESHFQKVDPKAGTFAIAWITTKLTEPVRLVLTGVFTPRVARYFGKAPPKQSKEKAAVVVLGLLATGALLQSPPPQQQHKFEHHAARQC